MQSENDPTDADILKKPDEETDPVEGAPPPPGFPGGEVITPNSPDQKERQRIKPDPEAERERRNRERSGDPGQRRDE